MPVNYLAQDERKTILAEITSNTENLARKNQSLMQFEIFKKRQHTFVKEKILQEMGTDAAVNSRIISSINLTPKITNEKSKIYQKAPLRTFIGLNDAQTEHVNEIYDQAKANCKLKKANKIYALQQQACMQIVPKNGKIEFRPFYAHQYDVIPKDNDPEKADAYIISSYDKRQLYRNLFDGNSVSQNPVRNQGHYSDGINQKIGDPDDYLEKAIFYWWTEKYNFVTNVKGEILDPITFIPIEKIPVSEIMNPLGELPFIDIAFDKDFEFFVREGNSTVDFTLDFSLMLSDAAEIARMQGFAQGVMSAVEEPTELKIGPRKLIFLKKSPNGTPESQPTFQFVSPSPDIAATNEMQANYLSMFLTSIDLSPKAINSSGDGDQQYSSGFDRYLAMLEKFESSQDDLDLFTYVEQKAYELVVKWNNIYSSATENGFNEDLAGTSLPEDSTIEVKFAGPEMALSETEKLDTFQAKKELGLISRIQMIMQDQGVDEKTAEKMMTTIDEQNAKDMVAPNNVDPNAPVDANGNPVDPNNPADGEVAPNNPSTPAKEDAPIDKKKKVNGKNK